MAVSPKRYYTLMMEPELIDALKAATEKQPELSAAAIIRTALRDWLSREGIAVKKPARKRAATRKRA